MPYSIIEIDGIQINPISKRFPVEIVAEPHSINDSSVHIGVLDDNQIPISIMRTISHSQDPHTMLIDGRDVSEDGSKLDTIETGAQVNNLTDSQAQSLTSGSNSNWHHHDFRYYTKSELSTIGESSVNWENLINVPSTFTPSTHIHDDRYFTKSEIIANHYTKIELNNGQLDDRYYTESEIDSLLINKSDINHIHDDRYYTESEIDSLLTNKSSINHIHDDRYYTENEIDSLLEQYSLSIHEHDDRYYTKNELISGQLDDRYYTKNEIDTLDFTKINKILFPVINNFVVQTSDGQISDSGLNASSFASAIHSHSTDNITSGILPIIRGGTNNTTFTSGRFIVFDGTKLSSTAYSNTSFAAASHNHSASNITSGILPIVRGGTNSSSFIANKFLIFNGTSIVASNYDQTNFSLVSHEHIKSNITDFIESDYVHITGTEIISGNKTFTGNVDIQGTLTTISSINLSINDNEITLNAGETGIGITSGYSGLVIKRGSLDDAILRFDETDDKWKIGIGTSLIEISTLGHLHDDRYYTENEINTLLLEKSDITHFHDERYYTENEINTLLENYYTSTEINNNIYTKVESDSLFSIIGHEHNDIYYTKNESDVKYSLFTHLHDDRYYTENEIDTLLLEKSDITHFHDDRYYTKTNLQVSGLALIHWDNIISKPSSFIPSAHNHNDQYYTKSELINGQLDDRYYTESEITSLLLEKSNIIHFHDDRYYTENEIDSLLINKSNVNHIHDDRYYTESEIDSLLTNKSNVNHIHDDRYYTESEITTYYYDKIQINSIFELYYTKLQLDNGLLDNRYFTKTELNNGQLDNRYYTKAEINTNYYNKSQLDNGQLNNLYYVKNELNINGASLIGISPIDNIVANNVQSALEELNEKILIPNSTLQNAYDNGNTISGNKTLKIDSSNSEVAPLELTNRTTSPSSNLAAGQIAIIENELYIYDSSRSKWITPSKTLLFGKNGRADGTNLRPVGQSLSADTGYRMTKNGTIISATLQSITSINKNVYIRINGINVYTMYISNGIFNLNNLNVDFNSNDVISVYVDAAGLPLNETTCILEFCWRK